MNKIASIILALMVLSLLAMPSLSVGAEGSNVYESELSDNTMLPYPDVLYHGKVTINGDLIAEVEITTDQENKSYDVFMETGPLLLRSIFDLGDITTNKNGKGTAYFDLNGYERRIIGPEFRIKSPGKPAPEFDTSYLASGVPFPPPPSHIFVHTVNPDVDCVFLDMSYGPLIGYPDGGCFPHGFTIPAQLSWGKYTIYEGIGDLFDHISINDPTGNSFVAGRTAIITLNPGEDVHVTFYTNASP